jgi:hypothetical protein
VGVRSAKFRDQPGDPARENPVKAGIGIFHALYFIGQFELSLNPRIEMEISSSTFFHRDRGGPESVNSV